LVYLQYISINVLDYISLLFSQFVDIAITNSYGAYMIVYAGYTIFARYSSTTIMSTVFVRAWISKSQRQQLRQWNKTEILEEVWVFGVILY